MKFSDFYYFTRSDTAIDILRGGVIVFVIRGRKGHSIPPDIMKANIKCISAGNNRTLQVNII